MRQVKYPQRVCKKCGEPFGRKTNSFFCDSCRTIKKKCVICGKDFVTRPSLSTDVKTCSAICGAKLRWKDVIKQRAERREPCANCGKPITRKWMAYGQRKKKHNFCNTKCYGEWRSKNFVGQANPRWRGGWIPYYGGNWGGQKRRARKRDNYTCQRCGITEETLGYKLDVHHKIPFRLFSGDYKTANSLDNLISLCRSCHRTVELNGSKK